jgi:hypothetical protein
MAKETIDWAKRAYKIGEKIFSAFYLIVDQYPGYIKNSTKLNNKRTSNPINK